MKRLVAALLLIIGFIASTLTPSSAYSGDATGSIYKGHKAALSDMHGLEPSMYTGRFYTAAGERFRRCVIRRESHANYRATNGSHQGAYQFKDRKWRESLALHMLKREHREHRATLHRLADIPMKRWPRYWQDAAFFTALNYESPFSGWRHWHLDGSPCNRLAH